MHIIHSTSTSICRGLFGNSQSPQNVFKKLINIAFEGRASFKRIPRRPWWETTLTRRTNLLGLGGKLSLTRSTGIPQIAVKQVKGSVAAGSAQWLSIKAEPVATSILGVKGQTEQARNTNTAALFTLTHSKITRAQSWRHQGSSHYKLRVTCGKRGEPGVGPRERHPHGWWSACPGDSHIDVHLIEIHHVIKTLRLWFPQREWTPNWHEWVFPGAGTVWSLDLGSGYTESSVSNIHWAVHLDMLVLM